MFTDPAPFFARIIGVYNEWLTPAGGTIAPFTVDQTATARVLFEAFTDSLISLATVTTSAGDNSGESSLVVGWLWQYFVVHFSQLKRASTHVHEVYARALLRLPWSSLSVDSPLVIEQMIHVSCFVVNADNRQ